MQSPILALTVAMTCLFFLYTHVAGHDVSADADELEQLFKTAQRYQRAVTSHHESLKRDLQGFLTVLDDLEASSVPDHARERRAQLVDFAGAMSEFCLDVLRVKNSGMLYPTAWETPSVANVLTSVQVEKNSAWQGSTVTLQAQYVESCELIVTPILDLDSYPPKELTMSRDDILNHSLKTSEQQVTLPNEFCQTFDRNPGVRFTIFTEPVGAPFSSLKVNICNSKSPYPRITTSRAAWAPLTLFRYNLSDHTDHLEIGKNITMTVELEHLSTARFAIMTQSYSALDGKISTSLINVWTREEPDEDGSLLRIYSPPQDWAENAWSSFTTPEEIIFDDRSSPRSDRGDRKGALRLTFNTAAVQQTAVVYLSQYIDYGRHRVVLEDELVFPFVFTRTPDLPPIPEGKVSFAPTPSNVTCDFSDRNAANILTWRTHRDCRVTCLVYGPSTSHVEIVQTSGDLQARASSQQRTRPWLTEAVTTVRADAGDGEVGLQCRATDATGRVLTYDISVHVVNTSS